eukprot:360481-Chlamydomonas_euryale.AAC.2
MRSGRACGVAWRAEWKGMRSGRACVVGGHAERPSAWSGQARGVGEAWNGQAGLVGAKLLPSAQRTLSQWQALHRQRVERSHAQQPGVLFDIGSSRTALGEHPVSNRPVGRRHNRSVASATHSVASV